MCVCCRLEEDDEDRRASQAPRSPEYDIVREDSRDLLFCLTTDAVKACCEDVEWVWDSLELNGRADLTDNDDKKDSPEVEALVTQMNSAEDEALRRLNRGVDAVLPLARCLENEYGNKELVIKALTRIYRAAEHVAKKVEHRRGVGVRKPFVQLMVRIGTQLNDALYELLLRFDISTEDKARGKRSVHLGGSGTGGTGRARNCFWDQCRFVPRRRAFSVCVCERELESESVRTTESVRTSVRVRPCTIMCVSE